MEVVVAGSEINELIREIKGLKLLMARMAVKDVNPQKEQIRVLNVAGLTPSEIADVLGTTSNTVSVALSVMKKATKSKPAKEAKGPEPVDAKPQA